MGRSLSELPGLIDDFGGNVYGNKFFDVHEAEQKQESHLSCYAKGVTHLEHLFGRLGALRTNPVTAVVSIWFPDFEALIADLELAEHVLAKPRERLGPTKDVAPGDLADDAGRTSPAEEGVGHLDRT
jgi:hypothetical protein